MSPYRLTCGMLRTSRRRRCLATATFSCIIDAAFQAAAACAYTAYRCSSRSNFLHQLRMPGCGGAWLAYDSSSRRKFTTQRAYSWSVNIEDRLMDAAEQTATGNGRLSFARRRTAVSSKLVCKSVFNLRCRLRSIKYDVVQSYDFGYKWRNEFCRLETAVSLINEYGLHHVWKKVPLYCLPLTLPNVCWPISKIISLIDLAVNFSKAITKYPTTHQTCRYTTWSNINVRKRATSWSMYYG